VSELQEFRILLQNQIDALENNQFDFLLYNCGSGGEFLSSLISKYSPLYKFPLKGEYDTDGRFIVNIYFLSNIFSSGTKYNGIIDVDNLIDLIYQDLNDKSELINKINKFKSDYLILDQHLNNSGRALVRSHHIDHRYMNDKNTFFIYPDTEYWEKYRYRLCRIKLRKKNYPENIAKAKFVHTNNHVEFFKKIPMSKMLHKGYLDEMFNIDNNEFYEKLIEWHNKNLNLLNAGVVKW
jgi:hypothetical protein